MVDDNSGRMAEQKSMTTSNVGFNFYNNAAYNVLDWSTTTADAWRNRRV
jgi:hypothetical protein